jgi:hypothetical protein
MEFHWFINFSAKKGGVGKPFQLNCKHIRRPFNSELLLRLNSFATAEMQLVHTSFPYLGHLYLFSLSSISGFVNLAKELATEFPCISKQRSKKGSKVFEQ